ncbi:tryptophan--tRNA ligase [Candidatus Saccharibacteria bacterium RIFCSPLOWO2_01_FULL_48_13]|nr:MAG: tryptophan--tRNA ligase [Candidatus Saccharibacteria bacterium RIFCSPHIGHO2_01_FULL_48_12]OGL35314.1 MAG: tryptophan--tRNA ligase [Candidatus Saccharibacteria bacterium RIFCSPHIGHO2_12_FULL_48_21]OGL37549.1 MAG: tryptophan--tRNA ligase [Candidatus Saccharibacteria bacterium RIFCSPLOWO2_01_FULL_48_13]
MDREVILTGLRSNGDYHLGNYLGAILPMIKLQRQYKDQYQLNMFIPDLHSFTTPIDHGLLYQQTLQNVSVFSAAGLDLYQANTSVYRQSYIPAHSEMTWLLDCFSYFGELSRMTEFKDKASGATNPTVGLFNYPVLMAADILLYGAKWVPVGEDQRQHLEFTRDLATRFNNKFGEIFVVPESSANQAKFIGEKQPLRIRSFRSPEKKMSKSLEDPAGTISLMDKPEQAYDKVLSATTDSVGVVNFDWNKQPGITNLLQILASLSASEQEIINQKWVGQTSYNQLKAEVATAVKEFLTSFQAELMNVDRHTVVKKLEADEAKMTQIANHTLLKTQVAVGLRPKIA